MSLLPNQSFVNPTMPLWVYADTSGSSGTAYNVNWNWNSASPPSYSPLRVTANATPSPAYTFLQARRTGAGGETNTFYGRFDSNGNCVLEYAWDNFIYLPMTLNGRPIIIQGDNASVLRLKNEQTGGTGNFTVDASNNLYWNGTKLN